MIQKIKVVFFDQVVYKTFINQAIMVSIRAAVSHKASGGDSNFATVTDENSEWVIDDTFDTGKFGRGGNKFCSIWNFNAINIEVVPIGVVAFVYLLLSKRIF